MVRCGTLCAVKMTGTRADISLQARSHPVTELLGKGFDQKRMVVPGLDEFDGKRRAAFNIQRGAIESDAGARVLRSQADDDGALDRHPTSSCAIVSAINGFQLRMPT